MSERKYADYFNIDPNYYPTVTLELIQSQQVSWENFYPHETFVNLLEKVHETVSRLTPRSIWLEGAYGSGKSHAALTVKSLFEVDDEQVEHYFAKYNLNPDLCQKFLADKNAGKIIVVHKISSSDIKSDQELFLAIQDSIVNALKSHGIENHAELSLKNAALKWLEKKANRDYIGQLITEEKYFWDVGGKKIDEIIAILKQDNPELSTKIMRSLIKAAGDNGVTAFKMEIQDLTHWIKNVIDVNNLKAILFIWDEFSEFLENNLTSLTGFQTLAELSFSTPFYFLIVSQDTGGLFDDKSSAKKIFDRFATVKINMPDNMALKLMAQAMKITEDPELKSQWENYRREINHGLEKARIKICAIHEHFSADTFALDNDLQNVIPLHPYTALLLKYLSVNFGSNQRSMFSFIISDETDLHAFKWYIHNFGPADQTYTLTADMLWDFFSERDNNPFNESGHFILNNYNSLKPEALSPEENRVLKILLLLQALCSKISNVDLLRPKDDNINIAFSGSNWPDGTASSIAANLVEKGLLFKRLLSDGSFEYTINNQMDDSSSIKKKQEEVRKNTNPQTLIEQANLIDAVFIPEEFSERFIMTPASVQNLEKKIHEVNKHSDNEHFNVIVTFALNENEASQLRENLPKLTLAGKTFSENPQSPTFAEDNLGNPQSMTITSENSGNLTSPAHSMNVEKNAIIFIDTSLNPLGRIDFEIYIEMAAYSRYYIQKGDTQRAEEFQAKAKAYLSNWKDKISNGAFILYYQNQPQGIRLQNISALTSELKKIDSWIFPYGLEHYKVTASLLSNKSKSRQFKFGAKCGITQKLSGQFLSPREDNSLSYALTGAWEVEHYWQEPAKQNLPIVHAKILVEKIIAENLALPARSVSVLEIYNALKNPPFGFMPNNFTAFVLGFLLKEYSNENFFWTNGLKTEIMNPEKLAETILNVLNFDINPPRNFREEFITLMSQEQKAFLDCTAAAFNIPAEDCVSIENMKNKISAALRKLKFPIRFVKNILPELNTKSDAQVLAKAIDALNKFLQDDNAGSLALSVVLNSFSQNDNAKRQNGSLAFSAGLNKFSQNDETGRQNRNLILTADTNNFLQDDDPVRQIGTLALSSPTLSEDLALILTEENCRRGLLRYIENFRNGVLPQLAAQIQDNGAYTAMFMNYPANFLSQEKLDEKLNAIILEYEIVAESNKSLPKSHSLSQTVTLWIARTNKLKISFEASKIYASSFLPLLEILYEITRFNNLAPQIQSKFLNALRLYRSDFDKFTEEQLEAFKIIAAPLIDGLAEQEIAEIFDSLPEKLFMKSSSEFFRLVEAQVKNYKAGILKTKLRKIWRNFTGTESPADWSDRFDTPILCMIDDHLRAKAKQVFEIIMKKSLTEAEANLAIEFMSSANFYDALNDPKSRDKFFAERFLKDYSVVLQNVDFVREKLRHSTREMPFAWTDNPEVLRQIKILSEQEYKLHTRYEVLALIDNMEPALLRNYTRDLLAENMNVGIEILKQQRTKGEKMS